MIDKLLAEPQRFDFFQAVRLLERQARLNGNGSRSTDACLIGTDVSPADEPVRFRVAPSLSFASSSIAAINANGKNGEKQRQVELVVSFLGLTGAAGVLPQHYTQMLISRVRENDFSLRDFLDVFHHRLISLFYRAGRKYRFPLGYEQAAISSRDRRAGDAVSRCIACLVGLGTRGTRGRLAVDDEIFAYYAGHYAHRPRNASALEQILNDFFGVRTKVVQFIGQWLRIEEADRSRLPGRGEAARANAQLGLTAQLGTRVWDVQSRFRIRLGPMDYTRYCWFLPGSPGLAAAVALVRTYVGPEFDFDLQPILRGKSIPRCVLGSKKPAEQRLGRNIWLVTKPCTEDFDRAAFVTN